MSAEDYFERAESELRALVNEFQAGPTSENWSNFDLMLEGAGWLNDRLSVVIASRERPEDWNTYVKWSANI